MNLLKNSAESKMKKLVEELNQASDSYYNSGKSTMTDYEYDCKLEELRRLENLLNVPNSNKVSDKVGSEPSGSSNKIKHEFPAKSLDKTKDIDELLSAFQGKGDGGVMDDGMDTVVVMWKLDGATIQLTYKHGMLQTAATRGNGEVGQDITYNAASILGIPVQLNEDVDITVRGEAVMSYDTFEKINSELDDSSKYSNPRNLAAASITMLDSNEVKSRNIHFKAFELVDYAEMGSMNFFSRLLWLADQGFDIVEMYVCPADGADEVIQIYTEKVQDYEYPVDGLVVAYNNTIVSDKSIGTAHHPNHLKGYALKWKDETAKTILRDIEWSPSRTGLLNPVAIFDTVDLEGTKVSRASLHNFSIIKKLHLHIGDEIEVYKANKIIPQVIKNNTDSDSFEFEDWEVEVICPECGYDGLLVPSNDGIENIICPNLNCKSKIVEKLIHFCSRDCMDIEGLSEKTIKRFVDLGYLATFTSIYFLDRYANEIINLEGFGETSWNKLWEAIENSKHTDMVKFLTAIGIPGIGSKQAKVISDHFKGDIDAFLNLKLYDFTQLEGFGSVLNVSLNAWIKDKAKRIDVDSVVQLLEFEGLDNYKTDNTLEGLVFVITGSLNHFTNRKELESKIQSLGGKVSSSVSKKTNYLINNDLTSTSSKNLKAMELGLPIITEEDFLQMIS